MIAAATWPITSDAHKAITSKYTYHQHVLPILQDRCGRCHRDGGVAPMSLLQYQDAVPWAEAMRGELLSSRMPPWNADPAFGSLKAPQALTAHELDVLLTWASGGSPAGAAPAMPPTPPADAAWPLGAPDLVLAVPKPIVVAADTRERTAEAEWPAGAAADRWLRAADLKPGSPAIVRSATIALKPAAGEEVVVASWLPAQTPIALDGAAWRVPAGASIRLRIHYKKTWKNESDEVSDRSEVGLYFAPAAAARAVQPLTIAAPANAALDQPFTFTHAVDRDLEALAIRAEGGPADLTIQVAAVGASGSRTPLIRMILRPEWPRQYAFATPIRLARGSRIEISTMPSDAELWESITGEPPADPGAVKPLAITLSVVPPRAPGK